MARIRRSVFAPAWRRARPLQRWHEMCDGLRRQQGSPGFQARGLAAGVFTGCLPFFGLQIVLGVALAAVMRGHPLLAAAGTWISNPFTTLPMCWLNLQLGILLLGSAEPLPAWDQLATLKLAELGWSFGSRLLLGLLVAPPSGWLWWWWLHRRRHRIGQSPQDSARPGNTIRSI